MDFLRRSIHTSRDNHLPHISTPIATVSKPTPAIQPPKKVIRALDDHRPQAPHELSFSKGDFFHVINEIDQGSGWYEANNPMTGARGLVPKSKFEVFNKSNAAVRVSQAAARTPMKPFGIKSPPPTSPRQPVFYAIVQHDFIAERADELDAKAGDHISVVAQSNFEWFVAKPISRLGRPGLIPVSFVAIHDPSTDIPMPEYEVKALMERGEVPGVEEWKRSIIEYKATSISLGVLDDDNAGRGSVFNSPFMPPSQQMPKMDTILEPEPESPRVKSPLPALPSGIILLGEVLSWHFEMDEYWFRIHALFQADDLTGSGSLPPARQLVLFRVYNDFYDFQVNLLKTFPYEAGQMPSTDGRESKRILPFMPGPSKNVDDKVTQLRKDELDQYLSQLCSLWEHGAEHILRHRLILDFFTPKTGDLEEDVEPAYRILEERSTKKHYDSVREAEQGQETLSERNARVPYNRYSDGSNYDEQTYASSSKSVYDRRDPAFPPLNTHPDRGYDQQESVYARSRSPFSSSSRAQSPLHVRSESTTSAHNHSAKVPSLSMSARDNYDQTANYTGPLQADGGSPRSYSSNHTQPLSATGSVGSGKTRSRAVSNANSPPISASNPNTAFVKIKIFDRLTQELIAIRVSPRVTHTQLMDKVRSRLGDDVRHLAYRNSISNTFLGLEDDQSLKQWLEGADKHVLYAD
ncbi:hypothetical protein M0805_005386 [Coniferiporia weirii]|nr:hypothetical protein M0805_005386 [Coniferiporia weirii]